MKILRTRVKPKTSEMFVILKYTPIFQVLRNIIHYFFLYQGFPAGSLRKFLMGTKHPLGDLNYFRVWHDNSGTGSERSWFLHKVLLDDLQTGTRWDFCDIFNAISVLCCM